ncbi:MAG: 2-amino-4-hydroxy-6-hydroxymethyldihydropteridine diphosphokinase [Prevotella sp.]|nr:2-amino-4-hydroxy-6-hydroxymethyldihydropteridine diphosphokinase [Prevotella sp.]
MHEVYFSIGTNIGDREANLQRAIMLIDEKIGAVTRQSSFHDTEPWGFRSNNRFLNAAVCCLTDKSPHEVLHICQEIERMLGRTKKSVNGEYHDRPIDIDILLYDDIVLDTPDLKIPHPLMKERNFVMLPLSEILSL